ncbi:hypothetical protein [Sinisalibacter aestuarii]|uniref:Uncharacterized protein n=1 Tax=Sinisalibacter aestuarii TaxID=2949426 RepID=A0ABQ5LQJ3_9RHOB|nr:hypothetical protein [Sinisalibacter aestuarii]GKY87256.1 hypothetical protein STA1M1_11250 [Sinisalibacter aestuarii]
MLDPNRDPILKGNLSDPRLWDRIRLAALPASKAQHEFAQALAHVSDLPLLEAREVEEEYRRWLYLAAATDALRIPPEPVRKAWVIHNQSADYNEFCAEVLARPLPLDDGARKFGANGAYRRTLQAYLREFGTPPPRTIWQAAVTPRLPRWLTAHAAVFGFTGMVAWERGEPLILALGLAMSLAIYGLDLYGAHLGRARRGFGADLSEDLSYFLNESGGR